MVRDSRTFYNTVSPKNPLDKKNSPSLAPLHHRNNIGKKSTNVSRWQNCSQKFSPGENFWLYCNNNVGAAYITLCTQPQSEPWPLATCTVCACAADGRGLRGEGTNHQLGNCL